MNDKIWTKDEIKENIMADDTWMTRAVLAIYDRQTKDEQIVEVTRVFNKVGFNKPDSPFLSSIAKLLLRRFTLTPKQKYKTRKKIVKYSNQLVFLANNK
jgi:hypothetical protein